MARKYRKIDPRIWSDERFVRLAVDERLLALYVLTCPQCNRIGMFRFSLALAAEDLGASAKGIETKFGKVCHTLRWKWDESAKVIYLPTWWRYNEPENPKHLIGCLKDIEDVPHTALIAEFISNEAYLPEKVLDTFRIAIGKRMAIGMPYQELEQEQEQEREQEQELGDTAPVCLIPDSLNAGPFPAKWSEWLAYRTRRKLSKLPQSLNAQLESLVPLGPDLAADCVHESIQNTWQGIFPKKYLGRQATAQPPAPPNDPIPERVGKVDWRNAGTKQ